MSITSESFLTLHYRLASMAGVDIINTFHDKSFVVPAASAQHAGAFGERSMEMVQWVGRQLLQTLGDKDETYKVGDVVQFPTPDGLATYAGAVQEVRDDAVRFDFNHPLAGQAVQFEVKVLGIL
jgi:FKBP-type peptidyl-prolyl cis-trans isomerase SlpA